MRRRSDEEAISLWESFVRAASHGQSDAQIQAEMARQATLHVCPWEPFLIEMSEEDWGEAALVPVASIPSEKFESMMSAAGMATLKTQPKRSNDS